MIFYLMSSYCVSDHRFDRFTQNMIMVRNHTKITLYELLIVDIVYFYSKWQGKY